MDFNNELPIPGEEYFKDFANEIINYDVKRNDKTVFSAGGIPNMEYGQKYIHFPLNTNIKVGDILESSNTSLRASQVITETYNGKPSLIKVHY